RDFHVTGVQTCALPIFALDDKFDLSKERIFISGAQAVIRMLMMQRERDRRAGLSTAGFISGYRGSPLGGLDQQLWRAKRQLQERSEERRVGKEGDCRGR